MPDDFLTIDDVADLLKVRKSTLYSWTHQNQIPHLKVGRLVRFRRDAIEAWLKRLEVSGTLIPLPDRGGR